MMRGPSNWARRRPQARTAQIAEVCRPIESVMKRHRVFRLPIVRGVVALGESLAIGFRALAISANYAAQDEETRRGRDRALARQRSSSRSRSRSASRSRSSRSRPALLADLAADRRTDLVRRRRGPDPRRRLHRSTSPDLAPARPAARLPVPRAPSTRRSTPTRRARSSTPEHVQRFSLIHPRCGTAFLLWVMVIAIFVFAFFGRPVWYWLIASRILLLPRDRRARLRADPLRRQAHRQPRR